MITACKQEEKKRTDYRLPYLTICTYFTQVRQLTNVFSSFSFHTLIKGNCRYVYDQKTVALLFDNLLLFSLMQEKAIHASVITVVKERQKHALLAFLFSFLFLVRCPTSGFTHSSSILILLEHYLKVSSTVRFVFSLYYSNNIFSHQTSLCCTEKACQHSSFEAKMWNSHISCMIKRNINSLINI